MSALVQPRLVNDAFGDPGLLLDFRFGRRAVMFDLGDIAALSTRELLRVDTVCVTHRHMDHFHGFDAFLRRRLHRSGLVRMFGPPGFVDGIAAKIAGYTWNLTGPGSIDLVVEATAVGELGPEERARFSAREAFRRHDLPPDPVRDGLVVEEAEFRIEAELLDHHIPVLGLALQERLAVHVDVDRLGRAGLAVGPWLTEAKRMVRRGEPDGRAVDAGGRTVTLGDLRGEVLKVGPGQRIAYVTDVAHSPANVERILRLAADADILFIEAPFLHADAEIAGPRAHLTARQAGMLAARAGARRVVPFHFSHRYGGRGDEIRAEVAAAFAGR